MKTAIACRITLHWVKKDIAIFIKRLVLNFKIFFKF